jgi:UDP:flavonoid glycosyltransferase YjiC (YdhE family)
VPSAEPPLILVSLSSTWFPGQTDAYQNIITALGALPVRGLVTLGGVTQDRPFHVPANVEVRDYADHAEILPTVSLVVGHGGHATTFSTLAHSKPLVMLPMHPLLDQPMVAASVVDAGAGLMLKRTASSEQIAHAIGTALASAEMTPAAEAIGAHLRTTDAAGAAANQLLALSRPVTTTGSSR